MAKPIVFQWGETDLAFSLDKIDRSKLYGYKELEVLDEEGQRCELATLAEDGCTVVGRGGTGLGYVDADGCWSEKAKLKPVDLDGNEIQPVTSSFSAPIKLFETVNVDEYLSHNIRSVYKLDTDSELGTLETELKKGTIFSFPYSFRGGLDADAGFLLLGADGNVYLAVGSPTKIEFIGYQQTAAVMADDEDEAEEMDLMDFDMI